MKIDHRDILGNVLEIGQVVVVANGNQDLRVAKITKLTPKCVRVKHYDGSSSKSWTGLDRLVNKQGIVVVKGEDALAYVLTNV